MAPLGWAVRWSAGPTMLELLLSLAYGALFAGIMVTMAGEDLATGRRRRNDAAGRIRSGCERLPATWGTSPPLFAAPSTADALQPGSSRAR